MSEEELRERLRRLQARARPAPVAAESAAPAPELPHWLRARLADPAAARADASAAATAATTAASTSPLPLLARPALGPPAELEAHVNEFGTYHARLRRFGRAHRHGDFELREFESVEPGAFALVAKDERVEALRGEPCVFLDIETNGLSGGAGCYAWLVALGSFEAGEFQLWQGFLPDPSEERALLAEVVRRIEAARGVLSFFGKSFDRHRLEDKMRLHGLRPPFESRAHLDLYWPCRRLYRAGLPDGRLATMERALCGVERAFDLPGSLAPAAWFDFLGGRAHRLEGVFEHNRQDVLSLVTLAAHLGRVQSGLRADGRALAGPAEARAAGLARLAQRRR